MLTCYGDEAQLPQSDLAYVGCRLAARDTLCQLDISQGLDDEDDVPWGYLREVPFLTQVASVVQVDLLADVGRRHQQAELHEASLLDAAVVYAAFQTAGLPSSVLHRQAVYPNTRVMASRMTPG